MTKYYEFPCGCSFPIDETREPVNGLPSLIYEVEKVPLDCKATWDLISSGNTKGVFQLESRLGKTWAKRLKPENIEQLAALVSLLRPGCLRSRTEQGISMTELYCRRKNGEEEVEVDIEAVKSILERTYGVLVFQEQFMQISQIVAGFNLVEVDKLRKCVAGDTQFVSKTRGWITIDRLLQEGYDNDFFLTMDDKGYQSWKKIVDIWPTGKKDVRRVHAANGASVWTTKYHRFLTDTGWKARSRLVPDHDYMVSARSIEYDGVDRISPNLAVIIAGIIAEGYFQIREGVKYARFVNHDKFMMDCFLGSWHEHFGLGGYGISKDYKVVNIHMAIQKMLEPYINRGLSDSRRLPDIMMGMTKISTRLFLSYLLACEGGVSECGKFEFSSKSPTLVSQVQLLLMRYGIRSIFREYPEVSRYRLSIDDFEDQKLLLSELTILWPDWKKEALQRVVSKKVGNFTTDIFPQTIVKKLLDEYPWVGQKQSGTLYTAPISRNRLMPVADLSGDRAWSQFVRSKHRYEALASCEERRRQVPTYDFTMEGNDTPFIIANGLVIHNSAGKKDAKAMSEVGELFVEKADKLGVITREEAERLFANIKKSAAYAFNASHAVAYSYDTYWTAHQKAHFPLYFFTSYLYFAKEKQKPLEEIRALIEEAKLFNISVLPPRFVDLRKNFFTDGVEIRFGLSDVKGIGEKKIDRMIEAVTEVDQKVDRPHTEWSWFEFLIYFSEHIDSTAVKRMIEVGAMRNFGNIRMRLLLEYGVWRELSKRERELIAELRSDVRVRIHESKLQKFMGSLPEGAAEVDYDSYDEGEVDIIIDKARPVENLEDAVVELLERVLNYTVGTKAKPSAPKYAITDKRRQKVESLLRTLQDPTSPRKDQAWWIAKKEEEALGLPITCTHVDAADRSRINATCKDIRDGISSSNICIGVEVQEVREVTTKKGDQMGFLVVCDETGILEDVVVFSKAWQQYSHLLSREKTVVALQGNRDKVKGGFIVEKVYEI